MSPDLETKLIEKHSKIFRDANKSPQETCMCWGLECGDGWYNLIDILCEALTYSFTTSIELDEEDGIRLGLEPSTWKGDEKPRYFLEVRQPQVIADQVKEKFGTLRFYYHLEYDPRHVELLKSGKYPKLVEINKRYADFMDGIVHFAETASGRTCEVTGAEGEMHVRGGWFKVINENVAKTEKYEGYNKPSCTKEY